MDILKFPSDISLSGNMQKCIISTPYDISFVLTDNTTGEVVIEHSYSPSAGHLIEVDLKPIIQPLLSFHLQNVTTIYKQPDIMHSFTVDISEVVDGVKHDPTSRSFKVFRTGVDELADSPLNFLKSNFLTWQPNVKGVTYYSPEFLTYYASEQVVVKCTAYVAPSAPVLATLGASLDPVNITLATLAAGSVYTIPVSYSVIASKLDDQFPSYYDIWIETESGSRLTYIQRYYAEDMKSPNEQWVLFENSLGGIDTFRAYGNSENTAEHTHNVVEIDENSQEYRVDTERTYNKNTGYLDKKERVWLLDFFPSLGKYIYVGNHLRRIVVTESDASYTAKDLPSSYTFKYKYADARPYLNIPRTDTPQDVLNITVPDLGSFTIAPRLVEFPRLPLSDGALLPIQDPYSEDWSATTLAQLSAYLKNIIEATYNGDGSSGHVHLNMTLIDSLEVVGGYLMAYGKKIKAEFADRALNLADGSSPYDRFLRKDAADSAAGHIQFKDGLSIGQFVQGFLGTGGSVDAKGNAEFESIFARSFISTPELRYNRITVTDGELWITNGNGIIESIDTENMIITLHLEENDFASVVEGDLCRGIYNNFGTTGEYQNFVTLDTDNCGFPVKAGFFTSYFRVAEILEQSKGKCSFRYVLRNSSTPHPCAQMKFAQYGNDAKETRQASAFISSIGHFYFQSMEHVDTWAIQQKNITIRWGWVDGFEVKNNDGTTSLLRNYGLYVPDNIYFGNAVVQLDPKTIDSLRKEMEQYSIELSNYTDVITVDDAGNVIDGLYKLAVEGDLTTKYDYRIAPAVFVKKGNEYLIEADSGDDAAEGTYKMYITPKNCTAEIINGTVCVTAIDNIKDGVSGTKDDVNFDYAAMRKMESISVVISVMCEGKGSITKEFKVAIKHDSKPYISMVMDNQNASVSWNTKAQKYIGLPYSFRITAARANDLTPISEVSVVAPEGVTVTSGIQYGVVVLDVTSLPQTLGNVTDIHVTVTARYAGIDYEQTLVHTLNRYEDVNVYELKPSVTQVVASVNTSGEKVADVEKVTCSVLCSSSDDKQYILTAEQMTTVKAVVKYSIDDSAMLSECPADGLSVSPEWSKIVFHLLIDGSEIDSQDVPVMLNGVDGEGIEYVFILTKQEVTPNITFDADSDEYQQPDYLPTSTNKDTEPLGQWTDNSNGVGANYPYEWCSIRRKQYGKWLAFETPKLWGRYAKDGENPYVIDLTNESSSVLVSDTGAAISAYEQTSLVIYEGTKDVTSSFTVTFSADGITCTETSKKYTYSFSAITKDLANVTFTATNGSVTLKAIYTVARIKNGAMYSLICSHSTIHLDSTGSPVSTDATMYLSVRKTTPEGDTTSTSVAEWKAWGVNVYYLNSGGTYTAFATSNDISYSTAFASRTYASFQIRKASDGTTILDSERVNAVSDGVSITGVTVKYQVSSSSTIAPSSWLDTSPSVTLENPYLWSQTTISYSKGSPTVKTACIGKMGEKGIDGNGEEWIYYLSNSITFTGTGNTNPANWAANQTNDYVMAGTGWTDDPSGVTETKQYEYISHRSKVNGTWGTFSEPTIWAKWGEKGDSAVEYSLVPNISSISVDGQGNIQTLGNLVVTLNKTVGGTTSTSNDHHIYVYAIYTDGTKEPVGPTGGFSSPCTINFANSSTLADKSAYYFEVNNNSVVLASLSVPVMRDGKPSFSLVDRGLWSPEGNYSYKYENGILVRDMVKYPIDGIYYYYMVANRTDLTGTNVPVIGSAQSPSNTGYWEQGSKYNLLVADVVYAPNATLGGFHINQNSLWAGGDTPEDAKVLLDGKNGTAKITGEVNATSGNFEYCNIGKGCTIKNDNGWNLNSDSTGNGWQLDGVGNMTIEFYLRYRTSGSDINRLYMCNGAEGQYMFQLNGSHGVFINASDAMNVTGTSTFNGNTYLSGNITSMTGVRISTYTMSSSGTIPSSADLVTFTNSSSITVGLPPASGCEGKVLYLKKLGSGSVTLSGSSSNLIVGAGGTSTSTTTEHVGSSKSMMYISDGTYWIEFYCG